MVYLIGVHYSDKKCDTIVGYRVYGTENKQMKDGPVAAICDHINSGKMTIKDVTVSGGKLVSNNGAIDRFPKIVGGTLVGPNALIVFNEIGEEGYTICNWQGKVQRASKKEALIQARKAGIANGKIVDKDGKSFISSISGNYDRVEGSKKAVQPVAAPVMSPSVKKPDLTVEQIREAIEDKPIPEIAPVERRIALPKAAVGVPTVRKSPPQARMADLKDKHSELTAEQKFTKALIAIKQTKVFYYAIMAALKRYESDSVGTMGVTIDELFICPKFVAELTMPQLVFVCLHEVLHIGMQHSIRRGTRNPKLWNVACDLYVNKVLCEEFNLKPGSPVVIPKDDIKKVGIQCPEDIVYSEDIDTKNDTVESIYEKLLTEIQKALKQQNQQSQQGGNQGQQGQNQNGQPQQSQSGGGSGQGQGQGQEGSQGDGQGSSGGQGNNGNGGAGGKDSGNIEIDAGSDPNKTGAKSASKNGQGVNEEEIEETSESGGQGKKDGEEQEIEDGRGSGGAGKTKKTEKVGDGKGDGSGADVRQGDDQSEDISDVTYNNKSVGNTIQKDIVETEEDKYTSDTQKEHRSKAVLEKASVNSKQMGYGGDAGSILERMVKDALAPRINWVSLVKDKLTFASQKTTTYSSPDRRFLGRGQILPGPKRLDNDSLENIKICIDTSGSITDEELGVALAQIKQLLDVYKAKAEVLYWDTQVRVEAPFTNMKELLKIKPGGGGGTDANCVFERFTTGDYRTGKKKPPSIIIMFTDGIFGPVSGRYAKYKDTIWVVTGGREFKRPFGVQAKFLPPKQ